jgi:hypothetical protein
MGRDEANKQTQDYENKTNRTCLEVPLGEPSSISQAKDTRFLPQRWKLYFNLEIANVDPSS